jgi:hypothetical protein
MLRISVQNESGTVTFKLEGKLAGIWVRELEDCWHSIRDTVLNPNERFDLTDITYIDAAGKAFLAARHAEGAKLLATGCLMRAFTAEISGNAKSDTCCPRQRGSISGAN